MHSRAMFNMLRVFPETDMMSSFRAGFSETERTELWNKKLLVESPFFEHFSGELCLNGCECVCITMCALALHS